MVGGKNIFENATFLKNWALFFYLCMTTFDQLWIKGHHKGGIYEKIFNIKKYAFLSYKDIESVYTAKEDEKKAKCEFLDDRCK